MSGHGSGNPEPGGVSLVLITERGTLTGTLNGQGLTFTFNGRAFSVAREDDARLHRGQVLRRAGRTLVLQGGSELLKLLVPNLEHGFVLRGAAPELSHFDRPPNLKSSRPREVPTDLRETRRG